MLLTPQLSVLRLGLTSLWAVRVRTFPECMELLD